MSLLFIWINYTRETRQAVDPEYTSLLGSIDTKAEEDICQVAIGDMCALPIPLGDRRSSVEYLISSNEYSVTATYFYL